MRRQGPATSQRPVPPRTISRSSTARAHRPSPSPSPNSWAARPISPAPPEGLPQITVHRPASSPSRRAAALTLRPRPEKAFTSSMPEGKVIATSAPWLSGLRSALVGCGNGRQTHTPATSRPPARPPSRSPASIPASPEKRAAFAARARLPRGPSLDALTPTPQSTRPHHQDTAPTRGQTSSAPSARAGKNILSKSRLERHRRGRPRPIVATCEAANVTPGRLPAPVPPAPRGAGRPPDRRQPRPIRSWRRNPWWREQAYYDDPGRGNLARRGAPGGRGGPRAHQPGDPHGL